MAEEKLPLTGYVSDQAIQHQGNFSSIFSHIVVLQLIESECFFPLLTMVS